MVFTSGERFPIMFDQVAGEPVFEPNVYALTQLRATNRASNTIDQQLRAVMVLYIFWRLRQIDFDLRLEEGKVLELGEVEDLVRLCRRPVKELLSMLASGPEQEKKSMQLVPEKCRMRQGLAKERHDLVSASSRVLYIRNYLDWLVKNRLSKRNLDRQTFVVLESAGRAMFRALTERIPCAARRGNIDAREAIDSETLLKLKALIDPASMDNPWLSEFTRQRNALMIHWLVGLGLRRGELLGVRISNIDFRKNTVDIVRRADDPNDPRRYEPKAKTSDRVLALSDSLVLMTKNYIMNVRSQGKPGLKHDFLMVSKGTCSPLSLIGMSKVFEVLRAKCPTLPSDLTAHVLRHTWNVLFSETCDKNHISSDDEETWRNYMMGWAPNSKMAKVYTARHIRERASEISLKMQNKMLSETKDGQ